MNTKPRERKLLPLLASCLVFAAVLLFLMLARQPSDLGEPFGQQPTQALRLAGLRTQRVEYVTSQLATPRLEYDLPLRRADLSLTNMVLKSSQLQWRQLRPMLQPPIWKDSIEDAERINELLLRRQQEEWRRTHGL